MGRQHAAHGKRLAQRRLATAKLLLIFAHLAAGYTPMNVSAALQLESAAETVDERFSSAADVKRIIAAEFDDRRRALLRLFRA